jgi:hypothetical protein
VHSLNHSRLEAGIHLGAETINVLGDDVVAGGGRQSPRIYKDLFRSAYLAGMAHEVFQQECLAWRYALASIPTILLFIFSMKLFVRGLPEGAVKG